MTTNTTDAMARLRESCAIAAGKAPQSVPRRPRPLLSDSITDVPILVTCWEVGGFSDCENCGRPCSVLTDGRKDWISCKDCETVRVIP